MKYGTGVCRGCDAPRARGWSVFIGLGLVQLGVANLALGAASKFDVPGITTPDMTHEEKIVALALSKIQRPTAPADSVPRAFGHPDFSGNWKEDQGVLFSDPAPGRFGGQHPGWDDNVNPPPFTPEYAKRYEDHKAKVLAEGPNRLYDCDPSGMPRIMSNPFPMELIQTRDKLVMLFEFKSQMRRAYMDGRPHPSEDDFDPAYMGHSTGKWEGETLVIDTALIANPPGKVVQGTGIQTSDKLTVVERVRFLSPDQIEWEMTFIDPVAFTKPWVNRRSFSRLPLSVDVPEYECTTREILRDFGWDTLPPRKAANQ